MTVALSAQAAGTLVGAFSVMQPGAELPAGWKLVTLPNITPTRFELVDVGGVSVVRASAAGSAASLARDLPQAYAAPSAISWRWQIDRVVAQGDVGTKQGDDYAARLYVTFDYPLERLSWFDRNTLKLARWLYGDDVPAAALCYVWANQEALGAIADNAYNDRVKMVVLRNANSALGEWVDERRDLAADFRAAFGEAMPPVSGIVIAADTDQTGETITAWFGDIFVHDAAR